MDLMPALVFVKRLIPRFRVSRAELEDATRNALTFEELIAGMRQRAESQAWDDMRANVLAYLLEQDLRRVGRHCAKEKIKRVARALLRLEARGEDIGRLWQTFTAHFRPPFNAYDGDIAARLYAAEAYPATDTIGET